MSSSENIRSWGGEHQVQDYKKKDIWHKAAGFIKQ
jgi:hypothetical protein